MLNLAKNDTKTTTGSNLLEWIMLEASKVSIEEVISQKVEIDYYEIANENAWRTKFVEENLTLPNEQLVGTTRVGIFCCFVF